MSTTATAFDWTSVAQAWDAHRVHVETMKEQVSRDLLTRLDLQPGERVLELGAGTGEFALQLSSAVGPTGKVIASDVAPGMVALLRTTLAGAANVEVKQLDAFDIHLPSGSVDAVVMRMGLMLVDEPEAVLRECRRVLTPGGRVAVAVWAAPQHNPWITYVGMASQIHGIAAGGPPTGPGGLFSLAEESVLERAVLNAGCTGAVVHEVATTSIFATPDEYFDTVSSLAGPLAALIAAAPEETRAKVRKTAGDLAEGHRTPEGLVLAGRALVCTATAAG
jgi:SAM-dependent methyltransferase